MPDYDVIDAGYNGLATATTLRRAGLSVLCLEKNRCVGGMRSTVELFDGYKFEIAVSTELSGLRVAERRNSRSSVGIPGGPSGTRTPDPRVKRTIRGFGVSHLM